MIGVDDCIIARIHDGSGHYERRPGQNYEVANNAPTLICTIVVGLLAAGFWKLAGLSATLNEPGISPRGEAGVGAVMPTRRMTSRERLTIKNTTEGLEPGDVVSIDLPYDPGKIELVLVPGPHISIQESDRGQTD